MSCGRASGKAILLGEHFVVYGAPALAVPLTSRGVEVVTDFGGGTWDVPELCRPLLEKMLLSLGLNASETYVRVTGDLPLGQGLGGSAALAVALLRSLGYTAPKELQERAHELERLSHGEPSGIDDTVVSWERPVYFVKGQGPEVLEPCEGFRLWVATTGDKGSTKEAIANAAAWRRQNPAAFYNMQERVAMLVMEARHDLEAGRLKMLGEKMNANHDLLKTLSVSTAKLDALADAARAAGAHGAKLTGAGLGGAVIALAPEDLDLTQSLRRAGAREVIEP